MSELLVPHATVQDAQETREARRRAHTPQGIGCQGDADTDDYRKGRAVSWFNKMNVVARDILSLKPTMESWVFHIACFIVPRQMVLLGDPTRRSCDACESFGAMVKKLIK